MPSERTFKAPVAEYNNKLVHTRFKYAEEDAHSLDSNGYAWVMFRDHDVIETETYLDGTIESFTVEQYVVLWNE